MYLLLGCCFQKDGGAEELHASPLHGDGGRQRGGGGGGGLVQLRAAEGGGRDGGGKRDGVGPGPADRGAAALRVFEGKRGQGDMLQGEGDPRRREQRAACRRARHGK